MADHIPPVDADFRTVLDRGIAALELNQVAYGDTASRGEWLEAFRAARQQLTDGTAGTIDERVHHLLRWIENSSLGDPAARRVRDRAPQDLLAAVTARMQEGGGGRAADRAEAALRRTARSGDAEAAAVLADVLEATGRAVEADRWRERGQEAKPLRFAVLGPVRAWRGDQLLNLGSLRQRAVLVTLLLEGGKSITTRDLVHAVWGENPPSSASVTLRTYVSRLRKILGAEAVVSDSGGYTLWVPASGLDLTACQQHVAAAERARAAGDSDRALALLVSALKWWKGEPLAGLPGPSAASYRAQLIKWRLELLETRLQLGGHTEVITELTALCAEHPLRQRPRYLLMLALDRSGQKAKALKVYADTCRVLANELDTEPGPELVALYQRIHQAHPGLVESVSATKEVAREERLLPAAVGRPLTRQACAVGGQGSVSSTAVGQGTALLAMTKGSSKPAIGPSAGSAPIKRILEHPRGGPTVLRIVLGMQLRRLREARGISREDAGERIRASHAKISRLELGRVGYKERDVADLLSLYDVVDEQEREDFLNLARQTNTPGWWHKYGDVLPSWFEMHIGLEEAASIIRCYEVQFVPGLLQTADYARAVTVLGHPRASAREIDRRVDLRMRRQELLRRPDAPRLWVVVDETAVRRPIGGPEVMRAQLEYLIEASKQPNVKLQIAPFRIGGIAAAGGPITVLRFSEPDLPDIVYVEQLTSALYLDKRDDVHNYLAVMDRLSVEAEPPANTADFLNRIIEQYPTHTRSTPPRMAPASAPTPPMQPSPAPSTSAPTTYGARSPAAS